MAKASLLKTLRTLLLLCVLGGFVAWVWSERILASAIAHAVSPGDPLGLVYRMRIQSLATQVLPAARLATAIAFAALVALHWSLRRSR